MDSTPVDELKRLVNVFHAELHREKPTEKIKELIEESNVRRIAITEKL